MAKKNHTDEMSNIDLNHLELTVETALKTDLIKFDALMEIVLQTPNPKLAGLKLANRSLASSIPNGFYIYTYYSDVKKVQHDSLNCEAIPLWVLGEHGINEWNQEISLFGCTQDVSKYWLRTKALQKQFIAFSKTYCGSSMDAWNEFKKTNDLKCGDYENKKVASYVSWGTDANTLWGYNRDDMEYQIEVKSEWKSKSVTISLEDFSKNYKHHTGSSLRTVNLNNAVKANSDVQYPNVEGHWFLADQVPSKNVVYSLDD